MLAVAGYALLHSLLRLGSSANLGDDDPLDNLLAQTLAPGYSLQEGPLYDWLLWGVQHLTGTGLSSFLWLKYGMLVGMAGGLFHITRRITGSPVWGFIAVESMVTVYQIFWRFHEAFTHRVAAMALVVATFWALTRLLDRNGWRPRIVLAACMGLGLLTEHSYGVFLLSLSLACGLQPAVRQRVFSWPSLAALPLVLLIVAPYALWALQQPAPWVFDAWGGFSGAPQLLASAKGLMDALLYPVLVLSPYALLVPMVFPGIWRQLPRRTHQPSDPSAPDVMRLLSHLLVLELAYLLLKDGVLFPRSDYPVHSLLPLFILGLVWVTAKIQASQPTPKRLTVFMLVLGFFTLLALTMRAGNLYVNEPFCSRCRWGVPYPELAVELRQHGFHAGTIVTNDQQTAGNLRRFFPDSRVMLTGFEHPLPPPPSNQTVLIWPTEPGSSSDLPADLRPHLPANAGTVEHWTLPWRHWWRPSGYRQSAWNVVIGRSQ